MLQQVQQTYSRYILKPYLGWYLKSKRQYSYDELKLIIYPGVFHPRYFFSTGVLLKFIRTLDLKNKNFCEPGAGSGIISLLAYKMGAKVICFDTNEMAVKGLEENFKNNFPEAETTGFRIIHSDLFDEIPPAVFDYIIINPPYFFDDATTPAQQAWYCGKNGEYFEKLFSQLKAFSHDSSGVYLILGDNCETDRIQQIANKHGICFDLVLQEKVKWEKNSIFKLSYLSL